jgi:hypothetical protein
MTKEERALLVQIAKAILRIGKRGILKRLEEHDLCEAVREAENPSTIEQAKGPEVDTDIVKGCGTCAYRNSENRLADRVLCEHPQLTSGVIWPLPKKYDIYCNMPDECPLRKRPLLMTRGVIMAAGSRNMEETTMTNETEVFRETVTVCVDCPFHVEFHRYLSPRSCSNPNAGKRALEASYDEMCNGIPNECPLRKRPVLVDIER